MQPSYSLLPEEWRDRRQDLDRLSQASPEELATLLTQVFRDHAHDLDQLSAALNLIQEHKPSLSANLIQLLQDPDPQVRLHAALGLGLLQDPGGIPALVAALKDPDVNTRFNAIEALGRLKAREAVEDLVALLDEDNYFNRYSTVQALGEIGDPRPLPRLLELLKDPLLSEPAVVALGKIGNQDQAAPITRWISQEDSEPLVAASALVNLQKRSGDSVIQSFIRTLDDAGRRRLLASLPDPRNDAAANPDMLFSLGTVLGWMLDANPADSQVTSALTVLLDLPSACRPAAYALGRNKPEIVQDFLSEDSSLDLDTQQALLEGAAASRMPETVEVLITALDSQETELAITAAEGLARLGEHRTLALILAHLAHPSIRVRRALLQAVRAIPSADKQQRLVQLLQSPHPLMRESAVIALSDEFPEQSAADLLTMLADPISEVRRAALEALPRLRDPQTPYILAEAVTSEDAAIRATAARTLASLPASLALPSLIQALSDSDMWVRLYATRSLEQFADPSSLPALCGLVDDPAPPVRIAAVSALQKIGGPQAGACIRAFSQSSDPETRSAAELALQQSSRGDVQQ